MTGKKTTAISISLVLIVGFAATSLASYFIALSSLRSQIIKRELPLTSDNIYSEIQRDLLRPIFISSLMANDTFLRDWVLRGEKDEQQVVRYLKQIKNKYQTFTSFFVSEKTRIYYHASGVLKTIQESEPRDQWYFRVEKMASDYEINIDPDMANQDSMTIFINYKVYDYANRFIGATGVGLTVSAVSDLIRKYQKDYDRSIYFVDHEGRIQLQSDSDRKRPDKIGDIDGLSDVAEQVLTTDNGDFKYKRHGGVIYLKTRYIPEFDLFLLVEQKEGAAARFLLNALLINLTICAVITLFVLFLIQVTISGYQERLEKMATRDKLTGIYNRQAFDIIMAQAIKEIQRKKQHLSIVLFDLDHFKKINDQFGHLAGDAVIQNVTRVAENIVRDSDMFCRWGGEEFLIVLKDCDLENAYQVAEKIRKAVKETTAVYGEHRIPVTISCGVVQYRPKENKDQLLSRADLCMYSAKKSGRNRSRKI